MLTNINGWIQYLGLIGWVDGDCSVDPLEEPGSLNHLPVLRVQGVSLGWKRERVSETSQWECMENVNVKLGAPLKVLPWERDSNFKVLKSKVFWRGGVPPDPKVSGAAPTKNRFTSDQKESYGLTKSKAAVEFDAGVRGNRTWWIKAHIDRHLGSCLQNYTSAQVQYSCKLSAINT